MTLRERIARFALARRRHGIEGRASGDDDRPAGLIDRMVMRWGRCRINVVADGAGRYRRLALGLTCLAGSTALRGATGLLDRRMESGYGVLYLILAATCGWLVFDLVRSGSLASPAGNPRASALAVGLAATAVCWYESTGAWHRLVPGPPTAEATVVGLAGLGSALVILVWADRWGDPLIGMAGRVFLVFGAMALGLVEWQRGLLLFDEAMMYALASSASATALLGVAAFEAKVLIRSVGRLPARR